MSSLQQFGLRHPISIITTSGGTTTLINTSNTIQYFSGTLTQTVVLPDATTMKSGRGFYIANRSTGAITIQDNSTAVLQVLPPNTDTWINPINISTSAGVWDVSQGLGGGGGGGGSSNHVTVAGLTTNYTSIGTDGKIIYDTIVTDTDSAFNTSTGEYTVQKDGFILVTVQSQASVTTVLEIKKNGTIYAYLGSNVATADASHAVVLPVTTGDLLTIGSQTAAVFTGNSPYVNLVSFAQLPNFITSIEVSGIFTLASNYSVGANAVIKYDTSVYDSNTAYSPSTGLFTIPANQDGRYLIAVTSEVSSGGGTLYVTVNGTNKGFIVSQDVLNKNFSGAILVDVVAADTIGIYNDTASTMVGATPANCTLSIARIGASGGGVSGANVSLSNLGVVAFNSDLIPGANNVRKIGDATHKILSIDVSVINYGGVPVIAVNAFTLYDNAANNSWDFGNRLGLDPTGAFTTFDYGNGYLYSASGILLAKWMLSQLLLNDGVTIRFDWQTGVINDNAGNPLLDAGNYQIKNPVSTPNPMLDWSDPNVAGFNFTDSHITTSNVNLAAPTVAADVNAGTGATTSFPATSTDVAGQVTLTTGSSGQASGSQLTVTFSGGGSYLNGTHVLISPADDFTALAASTVGYWPNGTATTFSVMFANPPGPGETYTWNYHIIGY